MEYKEVYTEILNECSVALGKVDGQHVKELIQMLQAARKVYFIAVGRVLLSLESFAKRLAHLGIDTVIVGEITEPCFTKDDVLVVGSGSGETIFPVSIAQKAKSIGGKIVHIGSNPKSSLAPITDLMVRIPVQTKLYLEDEVKSAQPMSSLFEQSLLLLGDSVCKMMIDEKNIDLKSLWRFHANLE